MIDKRAYNMTHEQILKENNAMLKVLLQYQSMTNVILEELTDWLNTDQGDFPKHITERKLKIRNQLADIEFQKLRLTVTALTKDPNYNLSFE
ncbi:hypothetical protein ACLOAU_14385 [Niabella sp. CJ426]|uniref:hypothetical protein n=1 Tax=Niabella sp. CJ426 TaxID=3393740 RepID=UPI003CFF0B99